MSLYGNRLNLILIFFAVAALGFAIWWLYRAWLRRKLGPVDLATDTLRVGEWQWRYHKSGRGPTFLLLHGLGANLYCWSSLIPLLHSNFQVLAPDLPGFGGSSKPKSETYGLDEQCERVMAFLDQQKVDRFFVVGNSMGGNIALWLAHKYPDRVRGVVVIAPAASPALVPINLLHLAWLAAPLSLAVNRPAIRYIHNRVVSRRDRIDPARIEESLKTYARRPEAVRSFLRGTAAIRDPRLPGELKGLKPKVLLLWGTADRAVSKKIMEGLKTALPEAFSHFHEGGGHHLQEDDPDWVAQHIVEFLAKIPDFTP